MANTPSAGPSPAAIERQRLRDLLRREIACLPINARDPASAIMAGRPINSLRMEELRECIGKLQFDRAEKGDHTVLPIMDTPDDDGLMPLPMDDDNDTPPADTTAEDDAAVEREVSAVRSLIMGGGFAALDTTIRDLVIAARKPAEIIQVQVPVMVERDQDTTTPQSKPTGRFVTWSKAFSVKGPLGKNTFEVWDGAHPDTPAINDKYVWPEQTSIALVQMVRHRNVMLFGPAGCGKTEFVQQIAARLGRPLVLISCDASTDAATLVGMTVPARDGQGVTFQPGQLARAIATPGAIVCLDEPSVARPGALFALQNVLTNNRALYVQETGQRICVAPGVLFFATDNTSGMGGGSRRGFHGTQALNTATLDRFGVRIKMNWHDAATETRILMSHVSGCTRALADLLVSAATTTRAAADTQVLTEGLGLRRLFSWAELLTDGIDPEAAFLAAVQNCVPEAEQETLRQQCLLAVDKNTVRAALTNDVATPPAPLSPAARDFDDGTFTQKD